MPLTGYLNKTIEISFDLSPGDYLPGAELMFSVKSSRRLPDSEAIVKGADAGLIYDPATGKGKVTLNPEDTAGLSAGIFDCDLQMKLGTAIYVLGETKLRLNPPVLLHV
jgi:hypothetical protein